MSHRIRQRRYVAAIFVGGLLLIGGGCVLLQSAWIQGNPFRWAVAACLALAMLILRIRAAFAREPAALPEACFPGLANQVTVFRGLLLCLLAGFLFWDPPAGFPAWIPALLFSTTLILDVFDGWLARLRNETSAFGAFLDLDLDAMGTLIAVLLAIRHARLPEWYLVAGTAYYWFAFGQRWRERRGRPLRPLPASRYRRSVAVVQSLFIALSLLPVAVLPEPGVAAALVMIPVLAGFLRDWLFVAGHDLWPSCSAGSPGDKKSA